MNFGIGAIAGISFSIFIISVMIGLYELIKWVVF